MNKIYKKAKLKNLISVADLSKSEFDEIIDLTKKLKEKPLSKSRFLANKTIALIFAKPSLRTRVSFEVGINQLGGQAVTIKMDEINIGTREQEEDIANVLSKYVNGIVIRTFEQKQIETLAKSSCVPVINGLSNDEHPCQAISDIFTIKEIFKRLTGLKVVYVGDGNNVTHSLLLTCAMAGIDISIASPKNYQIEKKYVEMARKINPKIKIELTTSPITAAKNANVIYTDVWASMGQEKELNKRKKIFAPYQINNKLLAVAAKNVVVLHCLPAHKGQEISHSVFEKYSKIIYEQAENRMHTQKAILVKLLSINK